MNFSFFKAQIEITEKIPIFRNNPLYVQPYCCCHYSCHYLLLFRSDEIFIW
jgi:hypothetical protein